MRWTILLLALATAAGSCRAGTASGPASPAWSRGWDRYRTIMWVGDSARRNPGRFPLFLKRLREMGVNTGMVYDDGDPAPYWKAGFPYYVENLVNRGLCLKWNSRVRDWDGFVTQWARSGRPASALIRDYCLDDPKWLDWACRQARRIALRHRARRPLAYDIRDELSVTISANPFDYDFNPIALAGFRRWLRQEYGSLQALNKEWAAEFSSWEQVKPFTTDQIKRRMAAGERMPAGPPDWRAVQRIRFEPSAARRAPIRWNFAPWADFRTYMDISLARALSRIREAIREADPDAPVGIEGTQMPHAFGGYDLWRLSQTLDWAEPYDIGSAREIWGSFMPGKPMVATVFEKDPLRAARRLWHLLLEGDRGCIIWWSEDCFDWRAPGLPLTPKARALAPVLKEMTGPLARLFLRAERVWDPIWIHYSQPSIQVDWLLESTRDGSTWPRRFSSYEARHNRMAQAREAWLKALTDLGYSPRFLSYQRLGESGLPADARLLVLPTSRALSDAEAAAIRRFLSQSRPDAPRRVLGDGAPGLFDRHGKLRPAGPLEDLIPPRRSEEGAFALSGIASGEAAFRSGDIADYAAERLRQRPDFSWARWVRAQCAGLEPPVQVPIEARVRVYRYRLGRARLIAIERNIAYHMSEALAQAGGNEALERPIRITATLRDPGWTYDLRSGLCLGKRRELTLRIDPWRPTLLAVLPEQIAPGGLMRALESEAAR